MPLKPSVRTRRHNSGVMSFISGGKNAPLSPNRMVVHLCSNSRMRPTLVNSIKRECAYSNEIGGSVIACETDGSDLGATQAKNQQREWQHG